MIFLPLAKQIRVISAFVTINNNSTLPTKPQAVIYGYSLCYGL